MNVEVYIYTYMYLYISREPPKPDPRTVGQGLIHNNIRITIYREYSIYVYMHRVKVLGLS